MGQPDLVHRVTHPEEGPRALQIRSIVELEEDELDSLPIPNPGDPLLLTFEVGPPPVYIACYRRALAVATKVSAVRARRSEVLYDVDHRRQMAQVTAEFALWYLASRGERTKRDWPASKQAYTRERGLTERQLDTALDATRFKNWIHRYEVDHAQKRLKNVDDILYQKIEEQEDLPPNKINPKLFDTYYRRHGQISPREGNKSVTLNVTQSAEDTARLLERVQKALPYAKGEQDAQPAGSTDSEGDREARLEADRSPVGPEIDQPLGLREQAGADRGPDAPGGPAGTGNRSPDHLDP